MSVWLQFLIITLVVVISFSIRYVTRSQAVRAARGLRGRRAASPDRNESET